MTFALLFELQLILHLYWIPSALLILISFVTILLSCARRNHRFISHYGRLHIALRRYKNVHLVCW